MMRVHLHLPPSLIEDIDIVFTTMKRSEAVRKILTLYVARMKAKVMAEAKPIKVEDINL